MISIGPTAYKRWYWDVVRHCDNEEITMYVFKTWRHFEVTRRQFSDQSFATKKISFALDKNYFRKILNRFMSSEKWKNKWQVERRNMYRLKNEQGKVWPKLEEKYLLKYQIYSESSLFVLRFYQRRTLNLRPVSSSLFQFWF